MFEYEYAIKTKGVAIQCIIQSAHAKIPKVSELIFKYLINFNLLLIYFCKHKHVYLLLQPSCNKI